MKDFLKVIELTPKLMASLLPALQARLEVRGAAALAPRSFSGDSRRTRRGGGVPVAVTTTQRQGPGTSHGLLEAGLGGRSREEPPGGELGGGGQRRARRGRPGSRRAVASCGHTRATAMRLRLPESRERATLIGGDEPRKRWPLGGSGRARAVPGKESEGTCWDDAVASSSSRRPLHGHTQT